jgi:hypothetical protein
MLKRLAILGILLVGALTCAQEPLPVNGGKQQEHPQAHTDTGQPAAPPLCTSEVCKENAENAERYAYYKAHPNEYWKAAIAPANASNWILTILGGIGGGVAVITLILIKSQADTMETQAKDARESGVEATKISLATAQAAQKSADAALLNAQVLINSERPWILVRVEASKGALGFDGFDITAVNRGRTPASILSYSTNCLIVDEGEAMPAEPECGKMKTVSEILLPDEPTHLDSVGDGTVAMYCVSEEKWQRVLGMDAWAYFVGRIVYRDLLSPADTPPHETQWAFSYVQGSGGEFYLTPFTAPPGWKKHT